MIKFPIRGWGELANPRKYKKIVPKEDSKMAKFIVWYEIGGEEDFTVITADSAEEARDKFRYYRDEIVTEVSEVDDSNSYLAYI